MTRDEAIAIAIDALGYALENDSVYMECEQIREYERALRILRSQQEVNTTARRVELGDFRHCAPVGWTMVDYASDWPGQPSADTGLFHGPALAHYFKAERTENA